MNDEPWWVRNFLRAAALGSAALLLLVPLAGVFANALARGPLRYAGALTHPDTVHAVLLTASVVLVAVPFNLMFGMAAAWAVTKHSFRGKSILLTLIDLPFSVSPVIAGLVFVLPLGARGWLGEWLEERQIQVLFSYPGILLTTVFTTFPFVARELIPVMQAVGNEQDEAARTLGAGEWQTFWLVTLPNIKWGLLYGVILCTARALGEYGAVSVVSGKITGLTDTIPLRVEKLYQEYQTQAAFAVASALVLLALVTLAVKAWLERKVKEAAQP